MKRLLSFIIVVCMIIVSVSMSASAANVCTTYTGRNLEAQNYLRWVSPIKSYLSKTSDGKIMKVQAGGDIPGVLIEYYDTNYILLSSKLIETDAPIFGGFYESNTNYFLVTGTTNREEDNSVMVYCVTKYDKSWNKLGSVGLSNVNTTVPFDAGAARMAMYNDILFVHTAHEMYETYDGFNHQANITFSIDTSNMTIIKCNSAVSNNSTGYVSHSFNQFIQLEGKNVVTVDHGDAHPRSIVLIKHSADASKGLFASGCDVKDVLKFPGINGDNDTGASIGGFEISSSSYLIAGNTVAHNDNYDYNNTRNIFVASVKDSGTTINKITNYAEGEKTTSTPQFVKIANDKYMLLWSRNNTVYYTTIDKDGNKTSQIYDMKGNLSDCVPTVMGNKLVWYVWDGTKTTFYEIALNSISSNNTVTVDSKHDYEYVSVNDDTASVKCKKCGETTTISVPTKMRLWWALGSSTSGSYSSQKPELKMGDTLESMIELSSVTDETNTDVNVIVEDESILSYETVYVYSGGYITGRFTPLKAGTTEVTFQHKYNPSLSIAYDITVKQAPTSVSFENSKISLEINDTYNLVPVLTPDGATSKYTWSSSDPSVVTVYSSGLIVANKRGTSVITVTTENGLTASCTVTVGERFLGDVNDDGAINVKDVILVLQHNIDKIELNNTELEYADIDGSGTVDVVDAILIQKLILQ
ncbi:MAG: Ig-like domain-containing protein [Acutalibacteraceae bacterium]|nr:Ig-like domain-containing protein [Acutalibacteraceae bacterium]